MATRKTTDPAPMDSSVDAPVVDEPAVEARAAAELVVEEPAVEARAAAELVVEEPGLPDPQAPAVDPIEAVYGDAGPGPFVALDDFTAMVGAQLCTFRKGATIDPLAGAVLARGGAPVEPA